MKILLFGRGVIATIYGRALEKAGNQVEFYVRPGRAAQYGPSVTIDYIDGRADRKDRRVRETWHYVLREDLEKNHDYDLIILSVGFHKFAEAAKFLGPRVGRATVLILDNFLAEPALAAAALPAGQLVWGFPGGGGLFGADGTLRGGLTKVLFFGTFGTEPGERDLAVRQLFRDAGFSISTIHDFRSWLFSHFLMDVAIAMLVLNSGGIGKAMESPAAVRELTPMLRELVPILKARGARVEPKAVATMVWLPSGLTGFLMRCIVYKKGSLTRELMEISLGRPDDQKPFPREALAEARRLGIPTPRLEAAEGLFR